MNEKMAKDKYYGKTLRKNFARYEEVVPMPNLLEIQKTSYQEFLDTGLREVFADVGAITDFQGKKAASSRGMRPSFVSDPQSYSSSSA